MPGCADLMCLTPEQLSGIVLDGYARILQCAEATLVTMCFGIRTGVCAAQHPDGFPVQPCCGIQL